MLEGQIPASAKAKGEPQWFARFIHLLDVLILQVAWHWLAVVNLASAVYVGLAYLAPYLAYRGQRAPAQIIYSVYSLLCHQKPERSFFAFGQQVAICQRDVAIYGAFLVGGMAFSFLRSQLREPLPWKAYLLVNLPLAVDGLTQLVGLRESAWYLRVLTGGAFGLSSAWLAYPLIQKGMWEAQETALSLLREGPTQP